MSKAGILTDLLAERHSKDLFVPQCKTGPTHYAAPGDLQVLDAWAMKKSWANPYTFGYEIKVSRGDFLGDTKWPGYLDYCTDLYFVAPPGIIEPAELPAEVGLLVASKNLKRLYCKRKAVHRDVEIPESLYRYVLMWRTEVRAERNGSGGDLEYWQRWLADREEKQRTGLHVRELMRRLAGDEIDEIRRENERVRQQISKFESLEKVFVELDINPHRWNVEELLRERVAELRGAMPRSLLDTLARAEEGLAGLRKSLERRTEEVRVRD